MSQDNNNQTPNENKDKLFTNEQSGWSSGNFPVIDLNFDIDVDEEIANDDKKDKKHGHKHGKKHGHKKGPTFIEINTDHDDHDHDHDHDHVHGDDDGGECECCLPPLKKEDITEEMVQNAEDTFKKAVEVYNEGDYITASDMLSESVSVLAPYYGDSDLKLVDIYYYYGDSILNVARQKILSSMVIDIDDDDEDGDEMCFPNIQLHKQKKAIKEEMLKIEEIDDEGDVIEILKDGEIDFDDDMDDEDILQALEDEVDDDLEVAWDVLELARALLTQKPDPTDQELERLSSIHLSLGSIAVETSSMDLAIKEYEECITIRKKVLGDKHRKIAEAYYMLAMAYVSTPDDSRLDLAKEKLTETNVILEDCLKTAEEQKNELDIIELTELRDEVRLRIEDLNDPNFFENLQAGGITFVDVDGDDDIDDLVDEDQ